MDELKYYKLKHRCQFHKRRYLGFITSDNSVEITEKEYNENVATGERHADMAWRSKMRCDYYTYFKKQAQAEGKVE